MEPTIVLKHRLSLSGLFLLPTNRSALGSPCDLASAPCAGSYVRSLDGALLGVHPEARLFLMADYHVLTLYDPKLVARVSVVFESH